MRVGIISMQRVYNYGSFLQAYALKKTVESLGHECEFIDIKPGREIVKRKKKRINYLSKLDKYFLRRIRHYFFAKSRIKCFNDEYWRVLGLTNDTNWDKQYDVVIIGSDEVFNCTQGKWGLSPNLFGSDINANKVITYAASCGYTNYEDVRAIGVETEISRLMANISALSVRDENTFNFVINMTSREPLYHLDPVFIYDYKNEIVESPLHDEYILVYAYDGRIRDKKEIEEIKRFAKVRNLKTISAGLYQSWCDRNILANPFELLGYVKNAKYIITDTFHGTVLAIKYNKEFASFIRESNRYKISFLLKQFSLQRREIVDPTDLTDIFDQPIDYAMINTSISIYKKKALEYLSQHLT